MDRLIDRGTERERKQERERQRQRQTDRQRLARLTKLKMSV